MHRGWTKLYRKIQCHWLWDDKPFSKGQAWIDLLLSANHSGKKFLLGNDLIELAPGQFVTSIAKLSKAWGWSNNKVTRFLDLLQREGMLTRKSDAKKTLITIENYSKYSISENENATETRNEREASAMPARNERESNAHKQECIRMIKNVKNDKNDKEIKASNEARSSKRFIKPTYEEVRDYCKERNNSVDANTFINHYDSNGWKVGRNPMKDWKAAVRTWEGRDSSAKHVEHNTEANMLGEFI